MLDGQSIDSEPGQPLDSLILLLLTRLAELLRLMQAAQYATGFQGPMSWLTAGKVDAVLDIKFPRHPDEEVDINAILSQIGRNVAERALVAQQLLQTPPVRVFGGRYPAMYRFGRPRQLLSQSRPRFCQFDWGLRWCRPPRLDNARRKLEQAASAEAAAQQALASLKTEETDREVIPGQHRLARPALRPPEESSSRLRTQNNHEPQQRLVHWHSSLDISESQVDVDFDLSFTQLDVIAL
jgi:hypothetical protein